MIVSSVAAMSSTAPARRDFGADLAIDGDRISALWRPQDASPPPRGRLEIDATGRVVAPGFIDVHTHDDTALIANPGMAMKTSQGVTSVVCGNCGVSAAPVFDPKVSSVMSLILKDPSHASPDFAGFAAKVEAARPAVNGAFLIGHSTLRMAAMGRDLQRAATAEEIARMRELLDGCLQQGAIGMSSGLFYPPAMAATTDEVATVAEPLGRWGAVYTAHMRDEGETILDAMDETFEIGRRANARVVVSHHKCSGKTVHGRTRETLPKSDAIRDPGRELRRLPLCGGLHHLAQGDARSGQQGAGHLSRHGEGRGQLATSPSWRPNGA